MLQCMPLSAWQPQLLTWVEHGHHLQKQQSFRVAVGRGYSAARAAGCTPQSIGLLGGCHVFQLMLLLRGTCPKVLLHSNESIHMQSASRPLSDCRVASRPTLKTKLSRNCEASSVSASSCCNAPFIIQDELVSPGCTRAAQPGGARAAMSLMRTLSSAAVVPQLNAPCQEAMAGRWAQFFRPR